MIGAKLKQFRQEQKMSQQNLSNRLENCTFVPILYQMEQDLWRIAEIYKNITANKIKMRYFSASPPQPYNAISLIKTFEFVVLLSYGTQVVVPSVSPSRTLS